MKPKTKNQRKRLCPAYVEFEDDLVLYYVVEMQDDGEYSVHVELEATADSECTDTEETCVQIEDPETARKLARALLIFADAIDDEEDSADEEEETENEEETLPILMKNEEDIRKLEDMGLFLEIEDNGGEE